MTTTGNDANNGSAWDNANAKLTIGAAIAAAVDGDEIWVKAGTYHVTTLTVNNKTIGLYGGFVTGLETLRSQRSPATNVTIIHGDMNPGKTSGNSAVVLMGAKTAVIDGFTITNGYGGSDNGGGIIVNNNSTISNNIITDNKAPCYGGGINIESGSSPVITNNTISGNTADIGGGISLQDAGSPTITNNTISGNTADIGGGISTYNGSPTIINNTISGNTAEFGGGIYYSPDSGIGTATIKNNLITGNDSSQGAGIFGSSGTIITIENNTIVGNTSTSSDAAGIYMCTTTFTIANNIIAFNEGGLGKEGGPTITLRNNCISGNGNDYGGIGVGAGDISQDPLFVDKDNDNYHLLITSPCIDTGNDADAAGIATDIDGQDRTNDLIPGGSIVDMGADEVRILHVASTGDNSDGLTWATAKQTVQAGINAAVSGEEVWVKAGTYDVTTLTINKGVGLYGGFEGDETLRSERPAFPRPDQDANETIIDGDDDPDGVRGHTVMVISGVNTVAIDGFTIQNGYGATEYGGGIILTGNSATISNNIIKNNDGNGSGGGIYISANGKSPTITNNVITLNTSAWGGAGIYVYDGSPVIANNIISGNTGSDFGGGICNYTDNGNTTIKNNLIIGNSAEWGGGINNNMPGTIINNTIVGNTATTDGGGISYFSNTTTANNIVAFNTGGEIWFDGGAQILRNNCVYNAVPANEYTGDPPAHDSDINVDPLFVDKDGGDYHLLITSPCIDIGEDGDVNVGSLDLDGNTRKVDVPSIGNEGVNDIVDMGAYELYDDTDPTGTISIDAGATYTTDTSVTLTLSASDTEHSVTDMRFSNNDADWSVWEAYGTSKDWTLAAGADGARTVYVQYKDEIGNTSASISDSITLDTDGPAVTINQAAGQGDPTNGSPINFTVVFAEPVTGFATGDVTLGGTAGATTGTVTETAPNDGTTYNVAVSGMTGDGTVIASILAAKAIDAADNGNDASTSADNSVIYDTDGPGVTINQAAGQADPTNGSPINFTVVFSESVTGFATGDVTLGGTANPTTGTVTEIAPNDGTTYNVAVTGMTGDGTVTATIAGAKAVDAAGNPNDASTSTDNSVVYDADDPTGTITINAPDEYCTSTSVTLTLSANDVPSGMYQMRFSNDDATWSEWEAYGTSKAWTLTAGNGLKTVYVQFSDNAGNTTASISDTITLREPIVVYVAKDGDNSDGFSWAHAKNTLSAALAIALDGDEIWVKKSPPGDPYTGVPNTITKNIGVYGGFHGNETLRSQRPAFPRTAPDADETLFDANGNDLIMNVGSNITVVIDGFTLQEGSPDGWAGGGIRISNGTVTVSNNIIKDCSGNGSGIYISGGASHVITNNTITNNTALNGGGIYINGVNSVTISNNTITGNTSNDSAGGGGIYCNNASPTITNNTISGNTAANDGYGGGIACNNNSSPMIANNTISGNTGGGNMDSGGAGISCVSSSPTIINNIITNNTDGGLAGYGGGISCVNSSSTIKNNIITGNSSGLWGGGIYCGGNSSPAIANNTIVGNKASGNSGGGIYCTGSSPTIANNIIAFNNSGVYRNGGAPTLRNNCVSGNTAYQYSGIAAGAGDIAGDPDLVNPGSWVGGVWTAPAGGHDYHLLVTSPCIDKGEDDDASGTDLDGNTRKIDTAGIGNEVTDIVDMGAYELYDDTDPTGTISIDAGAAYTTDTSVTLTLSASDTEHTVTEMRFSNNDTDWSGWEAYGTSKDWTLAAGADGARTVYVQYKDEIGNTSASVSDGITLDTDNPTVTINQVDDQDDPTNGSPINFTVVFAEPVTGFATGDVTLGGTAGATTGTVTETAPNDGTTYNVAVSGMTGDGTVIASILAAKAIDAAGNGNDASTTADNSVTYDGTAPTVDSTDPDTDATLVAIGATVNATFSEDMDEATITDITFTLEDGDGPIDGAVTYDADTKTATFTPTDDLAHGTVYTAKITTGVQDVVGNAMAVDYTWSFTTIGKVATPVLNPANGEAASVTVTCATAEATIYYTTNGVDPTTSDSTVVSGGSVAISQNLTLKAKAFKANWTESAVASGAFTRTVATPTFAPDGGTHTSAQNVTVTCTTAGATIYYTTNGVDPTTSDSTVASGGTVSVAESMTLKAKAFKANWTDSGVKSASYTITGTVATPTFNPIAGLYTSAQNVAITCATDGAAIYYTTDGTDPDNTDTLYEDPVEVSETQTLKAIAYKEDWDTSGIGSAAYTITGTVATPTFDPDGGTFKAEQTVTITCTTDGAAIYYTTDGTDPDEDSEEYTDPITVSATQTIKAKAYKTDWDASEIGSARFVIRTKPRFDINNDGTDDLAGLSSTGKIYCTTNKTSWTNIPGTLTNIAGGDLDGDGDSDIAGFTSANDIYYTLNKTSWKKITFGRLTRISCGDLDGDGDDDILGLGLSWPGMCWYTLDLSSSWDRIPGNVTTLALGDLDANGAADIIGLGATGNIWYTINKTSWTRIPGTLASVTSGDVDGDRVDDVAGLSVGGTVWYTTDKGTWTNLPQVLSKLYVGDVNGDGEDDLIGLKADNTIWYTTDKSTWTQLPGTLTSLVIGDYDGDGEDDIAGLGTGGSVWSTTNKTTWTRIPGTLSKIYSAR